MLNSKSFVFNGTEFRRLLARIALAIEIPIRCILARLRDMVRLS
jgi:hypothetical protein